jgi:hypothetical protein
MLASRKEGSSGSLKGLSFEEKARTSNLVKRTGNALNILIDAACT